MTNSGGDADLYLYAPNTTDVTDNNFFARSTLTAQDELIEATTDAAGYWFVNVYAYSGRTDYQLRVELIDAASADAASVPLVVDRGSDKGK